MRVNYHAQGLLMLLSGHSCCLCRHVKGQCQYAGMLKVKVNLQKLQI